MSRFIVPKIAETLEQRRRKIDGYLEKAEALKIQAEDALGKYQKALSDASKKAEDSFSEAAKEMNLLVSERQKELNEELNKKISQSEKQILKMKEEARQEVMLMVENLAEAVLGKLEIKNIGKKEIKKSIKVYTEQD